MNLSTPSNANLRRSDTTKGPPLRILSLDGGGVRGFSMLILLQELMHRFYVELHNEAPKRHELPKPCDYFDLIAGTGTGGLIAMMLGRLRMDLETCKEVYVRLTKKVFETDKTIAGIPIRKTLFKASMLEEAIRECVREHTVREDEGNDDDRPASQSTLGGSDGPYGAASTASRGSGAQGSVYRGPGRARGNPNALLYDERENRTKTAVTAVYKGMPPNGSATLLRSYDSRKEPAPEVNCTIWEAGRATAAVTLAFKPIQIGQSVFIDEGSGKYNPSPQILDEAVLNEWPARDIGVFLSIGTGKRPPSTDHRQAEWWEGFVGGSMGDFAEARRRLIAKIEGCEATHQYMLSEHLSRRGVSPDNYYRLNVEVGVGEFGMNEWNRLSDISTNTRMYLGKQQVQNIIAGAAMKMAVINQAKIRWERSGSLVSRPYSWDGESEQGTEPITQRATLRPPQPVRKPSAVELAAGSEVYEMDAGQAPVGYAPQQPQQSLQQPQLLQQPQQSQQPQQLQQLQQSYGSQYRVHQYQEFASPQDKYMVEPESRNFHSNISELGDNRMSYATVSPISREGSQLFRRPMDEHFSYDNLAERPAPLHVHHRSPMTNPPVPAPQSTPPGPPLPPKTPISAPERPYWGSPSQSASSPAHSSYSSPPVGSPGQRPLPYPDVEGPPPAVNMAKKPLYAARNP